MGVTRHFGLKKMYLKLMSCGILHYLWPEDLNFSQLVMSIFVFSQFFFNRFCPVGKV